MPDWLAVLLGVAAIACPAILGVMARDRAMMKMISEARDGASAMIKATTDAVHDRINRVRDEYVRRDDFAMHMARVEKALDETKEAVQRGQENTEKKLDDIQRALRNERNKPPGVV